MAPDKLTFFIEGSPVGVFLGEDYPTGPGRYLYSPYRGEGHFWFAKTLRHSAAECCFSRHGQETWLVITAEEFIEGTPECQWFVQVSEVGTTPGGVTRPWHHRDFTPVFVAIAALFFVGSARTIATDVALGWVLLVCGIVFIAAGLSWAGRIIRLRRGRPVRRGM